MNHQTLMHIAITLFKTQKYKIYHQHEPFFLVTMQCERGDSGCLRQYFHYIFRQKRWIFEKNVNFARFLK